MPYSLARYTRLFLLVPLGIVCMSPSVYSENSGSVHDGLCNYCAEHSSGDLGAGKISTSYVPILGFTEGTSLARSATVLSKPEMRSEKPLLFVDTGISVRRSESVVDLLFKNIRLGNTRSANDGLCNYCGNYLAGNMTADRTETIYAPLSGYALDANSPSKRSLAGVAIY